MVTAKEIERIIDELAPFETAESFDNVGILYESGKETEGILLALDITVDTVKEAAERGCGILVSHHPILFGGISRLRFDDALAIAVKNDVSLIAAHTNLDKARGGVNDTLAELLGLSLTGDFCDGLGRVGTLSEPMLPADFALYVKERMGLGAVLAVVGERMVKTVAVGGGAYDFVLPAYLANADALVTGELKHHHALEAKRLGLTAVAAGHYATENQVVSALKRYVAAQVTGKAECFESESGKDPLSVV